MLVDFNSGYSRPSFGRRLLPNEVTGYSRAIKQGLNVLQKETGLIIHNSSVPSEKLFNTGIGSLLSNNAQKKFLPFIALQGYSSIQQDPDSLRGTFDPSPYSPISLSKNVYMIPLEKLATEDYGFLLKKGDLQKTLSKKDNIVDYKSVHKNYDRALRTAYKNFMSMPVDNAMQEKLNTEFANFKTKNRNDYEPNAIYEVLSNIHKNENWESWPSEDRNLYSSESTSYRRQQILNSYADEVDFHFFKQWIVSREISSANEENKKNGLKVVADAPVAFTPVEVWQNKDLFFEDLALGCPPDYFSPDGQRWNFAVLKPEAIFNPDGTLGKGGELLRKRYEKIFESSPGGARIDHIIGLIDPFVYSKKEPKMNEMNSGRLYSSPNHPTLGKYARANESEYASILEKIVFPAAEKFGLTKDDIICEDLGFVTEPVKKVMDGLNLSGIAITQYDYRGKEQGVNKIIMPGSHDNTSFLEYVDRMFSENEKSHLMEKSKKLAEDTIAQNMDFEQYKSEISSNKKSFLTASFAELFTSPAKKVQVFFTDFFGIPQTYNKPGQTKDCWTLRLSSNFENLYYENLKKGTAMNLPEVLAIAIRQKGVEFSKTHAKILEELDKFKEILKS